MPGFIGHKLHGLLAYIDNMSCVIGPKITGLAMHCSIIKYKPRVVGQQTYPALLGSTQCPCVLGPYTTIVIGDMYWSVAHSQHRQYSSTYLHCCLCGLSSSTSKLSRGSTAHPYLEKLGCSAAQSFHKDNSIGFGRQPDGWN